MLFGVSPYEYHIQLKMQRAKELLLANCEPVAAIAYALGYAQASSLGAEFRKVTGLVRGSGGRKDSGVKILKVFR